uniref:C2 domain-containing protein n=1 Tax=Lotharella oceanica TaxID=641309 RepID=A0A7S2TYS3_9EUKA|mmetsp:Transcript_33618/g.62479  ORF Transcript_33618/g.62479 Transcript_33618/m.62479 type:complete len:426 (+) Transcript_33618:64-1341(+)
MANFIRIIMHSAKDLPSMDSNGFSDPYVNIIVTTKDKKQKRFETKKVKKNLNPVWEETFQAQIGELQDIKFVVMDYDLMSKDDQLGHATVYQDGQRLSRWPQTLRVKLRKGVVKTTIYYASANDRYNLFSPYNGKLRLKIIEAADIHDTTNFTKQSVYVKVKFGAITKQTQTCKKGGITPVFNDNLFFDVHETDGNSLNSQILISVWARGVVNDVLLGTTGLPLSLLLSYAEEEKWWRLFRNHKKNITKGEIKVQAEFVDGSGGYPEKKEVTESDDAGIMEVLYGDEERNVDVTSVFQAVTRDGKLVLPKGLDVDFVCACDPYPESRNKTLKFTWRSNGETSEHELKTVRIFDKVTFRVEHQIKDKFMLTGLKSDALLPSVKLPGWQRTISKPDGEKEAVDVEIPPYVYGGIVFLLFAIYMQFLM